MTRESVTDVMRKAAHFLPAQLADEMTETSRRVLKLMDAASVAAKQLRSLKASALASPLESALDQCREEDHGHEH